MSSLNAHLTSLLADATAELPEVSTRRMFGSDAWFVDGHIFALVWDGRVVLRVPDEKRFARLLAMEGAGAWNPMEGRNAKPMAHWVMVGEALHDDFEELCGWVEQAHRLNFSLPPKGAKAPSRHADSDEVTTADRPRPTKKKVVKRPPASRTPTVKMRKVSVPAKKR